EAAWTSVQIAIRKPDPRRVAPSSAEIVLLLGDCFKATEGSRLFVALGWVNNPMHNDADATHRKVFRRWNFSARFHFFDDFILVLALMNNDRGGEAVLNQQIGQFPD